MSFQNILVPIDGSQTSLAAVDKAVELAKAFNSKITVVQVMTLDPYIAAEYITAAQTNDLIERARTSIQQNLDEAKKRFEAAGVQVETQLLEGQVVNTEITKAAKTLGADLIVIGSHGRTGFKKFFLGSVAQSILGQAEIPVLVVRGHD
ncbi:universal stress protein [Acinetobacter thermotolerans]|uniref:universal stress protein n=1 Tax=Acinetobacter thermotolerans TaxID=3151487 RepID=UPI00325B4CFC